MLLLNYLSRQACAKTKFQVPSYLLARHLCALWLSNTVYYEHYPLACRVKSSGIYQSKIIEVLSRQERVN